MGLHVKPGQLYFAPFIKKRR